MDKFTATILTVVISPVGLLRTEDQYVGNPGPRVPAGPSATPLIIFGSMSQTQSPPRGLCPRSAPCLEPSSTSLSRIDLVSSSESQFKGRTTSAQMSAVTGPSYVKHPEQGLALVNTQ